MNTRLVIPLLLLTVGGSLRAEPSYALETKLYVYRDADFHAITLSDNRVNTDGHAFAFHDPVQASFDGSRLSLAGNKITWSSGAPPGPFSFVFTPPVVMTPSQPVALNSSVSVEYMEAQPDGSLKVMSTAANTPESPHYRVRVSLAQASADNSTLSVECDLDIATVISRSTVPGATLPVGKPTLATLSKRVGLTTQPSDWSAITIRRPNGSDYSLLLFLKLTPEITGETQLNRVAVARMQIPRFNFVAVADNRYIYSAGGRNLSGILDSIERFDTTTGQGMMLPFKVRPRGNHGGALINGKIYYFGGLHEWNAVDNATEIVDLATGKVTMGALMPHAPFEFATAVVDGKIYTFGGATLSAGTEAWSRRVQVYDPAADTWSEASPMDIPQTVKTAIVHDGDVILPGGHRPPTQIGLKTVEAYNVEANIWYPMKDLPEPFGNLDAARIDDRLYLFRFGDYGRGDIVEYNLTTGASQPLKSNYRPTAKGQSAVVGRTVYLLGGVTSSTGKIAEDTSDEIQIFMPPMAR